MFSTFAHGKLLLTGEYAVLDGALALAFPVCYGQILQVMPGNEAGVLVWKSIDHFGKTWFSAAFQTTNLEIQTTTDADIAEKLQRILLACRAQSLDFLEDMASIVTMAADFPLNWGLGSSSTLIAAVSRWAGVDAYQVLADTFGGSGYDIACAYSPGPLLYHLDPLLPAGQREKVETVDFDPPFKDQLYFIYLGKKQDSREGIRRYREMASGKSTRLVADISALTRDILNAPDLPAFERALLEHERLLADILALPRAQDRFFPDFPGVIKSLGAWGGDFVLATLPKDADQETMQVLQQKGFLVFTYDEMSM